MDLEGVVNPHYIHEGSLVTFDPHVSPSHLYVIDFYRSFEHNILALNIDQNSVGLAIELLDNSDFKKAGRIWKIFISSNIWYVLEHDIIRISLTRSESENMGI